MKHHKNSLHRGKIVKTIRKRKLFRASRRKQIEFSYHKIAAPRSYTIGTPLKSLAKTQAAPPASPQKLINEYCILFNNMLSIMSVL